MLQLLLFLVLLSSCGCLSDDSYFHQRSHIGGGKRRVGGYHWSIVLRVCPCVFHNIRKRVAGTRITVKNHGHALQPCPAAGIFSIPDPNRFNIFIVLRIVENSKLRVVFSCCAAVSSTSWLSDETLIWFGSNLINYS